MAATLIRDENISSPKYWREPTLVSASQFIPQFVCSEENGDSGPVTVSTRWLGWGYWSLNIHSYFDFITFISYSDRFYYPGLQNHCRQWLQPWNYKTLAPWKESYYKPRQCIKKQRHHLAHKGPSSQSYAFSSSHIWMWEFDHKEGWALRINAFKLWCWRRLLRVP